LQVNEWKSHIGNDFEVPVFAKYPELKTIKEKLYSLGAVFCVYECSGSAIYDCSTGKLILTRNFPARFVG